MKKTTIGILTIVILLTGCITNKSEKEKNETSKSKSEKTIDDNILIKKKVKKFKITEESMVGNWYVVASNPNPVYHNKILVGGDYISFFPNGVIKETKDFVNRVSVETGKYIIDTNNNEVTIMFNELHNKWRQLSAGKALEFYWVNTELNFENDLNTVYIKKGSGEWNMYSKKKIDMDKIDIINSVDAMELQPGIKYKITKKTPLMESNTYTGSITPYYIKSGSFIEIISKKEVNGFIWYHANIPSVNKKGWIKSIALFGQDIQKVTN